MVEEKEEEEVDLVIIDVDDHDPATIYSSQPEKPIHTGPEI